MSTHGIRHSEFSLARSLCLVSPSRSASFPHGIVLSISCIQHLSHCNPAFARHSFLPLPFAVSLASLSGLLTSHPIRIAQAQHQKMGRAHRASLISLALTQLPSSLSLFHARTLSHSASLPISIDPARHPLWHGNDDGTAMASTRLQMWH